MGINKINKLMYKALLTLIATTQAIDN